MNHSPVTKRSARSLTRLTVGALAAVVLFSAVGCEGKKAISGKVTLNGAPVNNGTVTFVGDDNTPAAVASINTEGAYLIEGLAPGTYRVTVFNMPTNLPIQGKQPPAVKDARLPQPPTEVALPRKYASPDNGLTCTVTKGRQTFDIPMTP